ncbi:hypothetical protein [uncultured Deinococcus sp.]|uniref:hypothetical protein n=1 Tax=uncultured Deinococcus sp. TaxID=158789 RepID=UPI0025EED29F|nr:hypothetical protein [uncultured Deinococcus sp.]
MTLRALLLSLSVVAGGHAAALTVAGSADGAGPDARIAGFVVSAYGQPIQELVSVPITGGRFSLEIPTTVPPARAQTTLTPRNVTWPGVIDPVTVSAPVQSAELKFFVYRDTNANGHRDETEPMREAPPTSGPASLFVTWVSSDVTVTASKGYSATLVRGWNAFLVEVGRAVAVRPFGDDQVLRVRVGR